jgi:hypothetical protein
MQRRVTVVFGRMPLRRVAAQLRENLPFGAEKFPIPKTEIGTSGWRSPAYMLPPSVAPAEHLVFSGGA